MMNNFWRFARFTDTARRVCQKANDEARRLYSDVIETEHLLVGLSQAPRRNLGLIVLERLGVTPPIIHAEVAKMVYQGPVPPPWGKLPYGPSGKKALDYAIEEAQRLGDPYVGSEHLLLGLLREQDGTAARVLANLGVGLDKARAELQKLADESNRRGPWFTLLMSLLALMGRLLGRRKSVRPFDVHPLSDAELDQPVSAR